MSSLVVWSIYMLKALYTADHKVSLWKLGALGFNTEVLNRLKNTLTKIVQMAKADGLISVPFNFSWLYWSFLKMFFCFVFLGYFPTGFSICFQHEKSWYTQWETWLSSSQTISDPQRMAERDTIHSKWPL